VNYECGTRLALQALDHTHARMGKSRGSGRLTPEFSSGRRKQKRAQRAIRESAVLQRSLYGDYERVITTSKRTP